MNNAPRFIDLHLSRTDGVVGDPAAMQIGFIGVYMPASSTHHEQFPRAGAAVGTFPGGVIVVDETVEQIRSMIRGDA